jgi:hypothetical protein
MMQRIYFGKYEGRGSRPSKVPIESGISSRYTVREAFRATRQLICHPYLQWLFLDPSTDRAPREMLAMSDVEDYPGPSRQPVKQGQNPHGRADQGMVKPPLNPGPKKEKSRKQRQKRR